MAARSSCGSPLPGGARFCPNCAAPVADERPSEERKLATVLFADLVGSTEMASSQDAERTRALLTRFYDAMAAEIADAGGRSRNLSATRSWRLSAPPSHRRT